jgi:hypothetical protein
MYSLIQVPIFLLNGLNNQEYLQVRNDYILITKKFQRTPEGEFIGGMPVTMENDCFKPLIRVDSGNRFVYNITLKVDGERYLLFLSSWGEIYLIDRLLNFFIFLDSSGKRLPRINNVLPFLIDGELVMHSKTEYEFLIFDLLFYQSAEYITSNYYIRYDVAKFALENVLSGYFDLFQGINISLKQWFPITDILSTDNIYSSIESKTNVNRLKKYSLKADGLILQPFDTEYSMFGPWNKYNNIQFKWKPSHDQTMDFKIKIASPNRWELLTKSGYPFTMPVSGLVANINPTEANKKMFKDGDVAEFTFLNNSFKILRPRPNKQANSKDAIMSVMNFISNPFTLDSLKPMIHTLVSGKDLSGLLSGISKSRLILCILKNKMFFTKSEIDNISKIWNVYSSDPINKELEFRVIKKGKQGSSVDKFTFMYLYEYLITQFEVTQTNTVDIAEQRTDKSGPTFRSTYASLEDVPLGKSIINEMKRPIKIFFQNDPKETLYNNMQFKLALSEESKTNKVIGFKTMVPGKRAGINNNIRIKNRYSFTIGIWRIDLTVVISGYSTEEIKDKREDYEIECEFIGKKDISFNRFIKSFSNLYILLLENTGYC